MGMNKEVRRFNPRLTIEEAHRPPYSWYTYPELWEEEKHEVFEKCWVPVGRVDQVQKPGDMFHGHVVDNPYVVVRDEQGVLRAFHNVCRHAAAAVVNDCGNRCELVCPYHGWKYGLDGGLKSAPAMGKMKNFNVKEEGLKPISVATFGPFIFLDLDGYWGADNTTREVSTKTRNLEKDVEEIKKHLDELGFANMRFHSQQVYEINCNWKVFVDNSLDGGYHVGYIHEALAEGLESSALETTVFDGGRTSVQIGKGKDDPRLGNKVCYAYLFPNFFINRYGNTMETNTVLPLGINRCKVVFDFYFDFPNFEDFATKKNIKHCLDSAHQTQKEDITICESVQRGMSSMSYEHGRYSEQFEKAVHAFHIRLWDELDKRGL